MKKVAKIVVYCVISAFALASLNACGYKDYANAVKEQNLTIQQKRLMYQADKESERRIHKEKMLLMAISAMAAAKTTEDGSDDVMVPMLIMTLENSWIMSEAIASMNYKPEQTFAIQAPDSFGDGVKKSAGAILGIGAIALGFQNSKNMKDIAVAGMNGAGTNITGDNNTYSSGSGDSLGTLDLSGEGSYSNIKPTTTDIVEDSEAVSE